MNETFGLVVRFTLKPDHEEAFDQLVDETLVGVTANEPETLIYTCHSVEDRPEQRVFYELYRDRRAFNDHENQPHVRRFLAERAQHLQQAEVDVLTLLGGKGVAVHG